MDISTMVSTYNAAGGFSVFTYVDALFEIERRNYGDAVRSIELYVRLPSPIRNPRPTLGGLFDRWHTSLAKLPFIKFRRQLKRCEIAFVSEHFDASDYEDSPSDEVHLTAVAWHRKQKALWKVTPERIHDAAAEVADALQLLRKRIKRDDDFDVDQFLLDADKLLRRTDRTWDEWEFILAKGQELEAARLVR